MEEPIAPDSSVEPTRLSWGRRAALEIGYLLFLLVLLECLMRLAGGVLLLTRQWGDSESRPAGEVRILAIGESTTFGLGVDPSQSYPAQLEAILRERLSGPVTVINAGVPGQTSTSILRTIDSLLAEHRPSVVLALFGVNDLNEALNDLSSRRVLGWNVPDWIADLRLYRLFCVVRDWVLYRPKVEDHGAWVFFDQDQKGTDGSWVENPEFLTQLELNIATIAAKVAAAGAVYVQHSYLKETPNLRELYRRVSEDQGFLFLDAHNAEWDIPDHYTEDTFHPNPAGHRLMAEFLAERLVAESVIAAASK